MTTEQHLVRWIYLAPTLLLIFVFLPAVGGQYQLMGLFDVDFLSEGVDWFKLLVAVIAVVMGFIILEQYASRSMDVQDTRKRRNTRYANTSVEMTPLRGSLMVLLFLVCGTVPVAYGKMAWEAAQISRVTSAAKNADLGTLTALLKANPKMKDAKGYLGRTPIFWAAYSGADAVATYLAKQKANLNIQDDRGWTPLHAAAFRNRDEMVKLLIDLGVKTTVKDAEGNSPLHVAALGYNVDVVKVLKDQGFNLEDTNKLGRTPLHVAADHLQYAMVEALLDNGAAVNAKDNAGRTPLALAHQKGKNQDVATLLVDRGGDD